MVVDSVTVNVRTRRTVASAKCEIQRLTSSSSALIDTVAYIVYASSLDN